MLVSGRVYLYQNISAPHLQRQLKSNFHATETTKRKKRGQPCPPTPSSAVLLGYGKTLPISRRFKKKQVPLGQATPTSWQSFKYSLERDPVQSKSWSLDFFVEVNGYQDVPRCFWRKKSHQLLVVGSKKQRKHIIVRLHQPCNHPFRLIKRGFINKLYL